MTQAQNSSTPQSRTQILDQLKADMERLYGMAAEEIDTETSFIALGADSLMLLQASRSIEERFGVKVPFRMLMEEVDTPSSLAAHIETQLPEEAAPPAAAPPASAVPASAVPAAAVPAGNGNPTPRVAPATARFARPPAVGGSALERLFEQQLAVMAQQLEVLGGSADIGNGTRAEAAAAPPQSVTPPADNSSKDRAQTDRAPTDRTPKGHNQGPSAGAIGLELTPQQQAFVDGLVERLDRRNAGSKRVAEEQRFSVADGRTSARLRVEWKDLCYQIAVDRGEGGRIWDIDGSEYVDITMGYGALLFGHSPPFLRQALEEGAARGMRLGPQNAIGGDVAELIRQLTGVDRVSFFNSGTEAVMAGVRMARTVTGRDKICMFNGSYHGSYDAVMARSPDFAADETPRALPGAPGIPAATLREVMVLDPVPESIEMLERHGHELAAILIEPKQSRRPDLTLRDFLHQVRRVADKTGACLIFDEVITGFRTHPGGIQALYDVRADLVAYGKAVGAGMPIGVIAGRSRFMDSVDGGTWSFADDSFPLAEMTQIRGTFFKHPLVMTVARGALAHLAERGPALQEELSERTAGLVARLNEIFEKADVAIYVNRFTSLFIFGFHSRLMAADWDLFYYQLLEKGVYVWEQRICYLSTAHTDKDVEHVVTAVRETVEVMKAAGFLNVRRTAAPEP